MMAWSFRDASKIFDRLILLAKQSIVCNSKLIWPNFRGDLRNLAKFLCQASWN